MKYKKHMNERIRELSDRALNGETIYYTAIPVGFVERFAELIIEDACRALNPMLRDMISRGQGVDLIRKHFGVDK